MFPRLVAALMRLLRGSATFHPLVLCFTPPAGPSARAGEPRAR